jgi:hypothetical protein
MRAFRVVPKLSCLLLLASLSSLAQAQVTQPGLRPPPRPTPGGTTPTSEATALTDDEALRAAGLTATDGPKLIEYLKQRTLSDLDQGKMAGIIKRFGSDEFDDRVKATREIELYGSAAIASLKTAERDSDPEVAYRAKVALKKMAKVPHSIVSAAAVRALLKLKPEGAVAALIGFLPLADDESIAESIREALIVLALKEGKAEPALVAALHDNSPIRRSAAYVALTLGGPASERIRIKETYPQLKEAVLQEKDPEAKFVGLWTLLLTTQDKGFVAELIGLIPQIGRGRIWQLEDLLIQLAGSYPKEGRFLKSPEALAKARDAWLAWWKEKGEKIDFVKFDYKPGVLGITDIIEMDHRGYGQGRVISLGPDMKERWRITPVNNPTDFMRLPRDRILLVESLNNQITERTISGAIQATHMIYQQPLNIQKTSDDGMLVVCRNRIVEFDKDWNQRAGMEYQRNTFDIISGLKLPNGDVLCVINAYQGANCIRLDSKLKDTNKTYTFGRIQNPHAMEVVGDDKILVCELDRVAEYDLKTGKQTWKHECAGPTSCQRLKNGNTLISVLNNASQQLIEVDPSGEVVWDYSAKDGLRVGRALRR